MLLLGTSEACRAVEALGFKAEEAFLEDSAIRMLRQSTKAQTPFRFVLLDLDDNTIDVARFAKNARLIAKEFSFTITIIGCSEFLPDEMRRVCDSNNVVSLYKPLDEENLKSVLTKM